MIVRGPVSVNASRNVTWDINPDNIYGRNQHQCLDIAASLLFPLFASHQVARQHWGHLATLLMYADREMPLGSVHADQEVDEETSSVATRAPQHPHSTDASQGSQLSGGVNVHNVDTGM
jgi:hypothetical protein